MKPLQVFSLALWPLLASAHPLKAALLEPATQPTLQTASDRWSSAAKAETPSFRRHILPLMSRLGCSGRECHGAFSGQGGFQLSLFGYDFEKDHREITSDQEDGFRVDSKEPPASLILAKPALDGEKHKGKKVIAKGSWEYNLMLKWVVSGAKNDAAETGELDRLEVLPGELIFEKPRDAVQLKVLAHWQDGTVEDVTQITRFRTNDESVAEVSATGLVTSKEKGDTHIVAFYDNGVQPVPAMLPASEFSGEKFPTIPARTKVDELVANKLRKAGIVPSEVCTDAEFLRRVSLDMTATLPTPGEVRAFLADRSPDKRAKKVEELLRAPGYATWWATLLCDFSGNDPRRLSAPTGDENFFSELLSRQWFDWVRRRVEDNERYDRIAAGMILATGRTKPDQSFQDFSNEMSSYFASANPVDFASRPNMPYFWQRNNLRKPEEKALAFAHAFLGVRIECAQCHKHPFDQWTKKDFEQFQAFFEPLRYEGKPSAGEEVDFKSTEKTFKASLDPQKMDAQKYRAAEFKKQIDEGAVLPWPEVFTVNRPLTQKEINKRKENDPNFSGRVLTPKVLGGEEVLLTQYFDPRQPLMDWLRAPANPYFAQAFVNRVWAAYFGRGIVDPADDMNLANPPSNKELLDYLADGFVKSAYDMKWLHREITNSDAYQRSWRTTPSNKRDDKNFSHAVIRRLPAEVVFDSIAMAAASSAEQEKFPRDLESRAIGPNATISGKVNGGDRYALTTFGKPSRNMNCDCERTSDPTLLQTIYTRNDPALIQLLDAKTGWIAELRRAGENPAALDAMIEEVFLRTLSRPPSETEFAQARQDVAASSKSIDGLRELLWTLLNTREFMVNH